jgi:hypothetical protein
MDKKIILLLSIITLIFLEFYFSVFSNIITGLVSIGLSISSEPRICLEFLDMPLQMIQESSYNIRVGLHNCGSLVLNSTLVLETRNLNNATRGINEEPVLNLSVDERRTIIVSWRAYPSPGEYTMYVYSTYDNDSSNVIYSNFTVLPAPPAPPSPSITPSFQVVKITNMSVTHPPRLNMTQDAEYIVLIKVENNGDLDIHDLYLELKSTQIATEVIFPEIKEVLEPGLSVIFTTKLKVSKELNPRNYTIEWIIRSNEMVKTGKIIGEVRILDTKEKAKDLLLYYTNLLNTIEDEINLAEKEGKNITTVIELFEDSTKELDVAKELFRLGLYESCIEHLETVRIKIVQVVRLLVYAEYIKEPFLLPALPMIPCIIWTILITIINSVVAIFLKRKLNTIRIVLIMGTISLFIILLSGIDCIFWSVFTSLATIAIFLLVILIEKIKRERPYLLRFRRW